MSEPYCKSWPGCGGPNHCWRCAEGSPAVKGKETERLRAEVERLRTAIEAMVADALWAECFSGLCTGFYWHVSAEAMGELFRAMSAINEEECCRGAE